MIHLFPRFFSHFPKIRNTSWQRLLFPTGSILIFLAQFIFLFQTGDAFLTDPATARHLRAGEILLQSRHFFYFNPFGFIKPPLPWIDFEWLFEAASAFLFLKCGLPFLYGCGFFIFSLFPVLMWRLLVRENIAWPVALAYTLLFALAMRVHLLFRPFLFTYLFSLIIVYAWQRNREGPGRFAWPALFVVFMLWSNLHGGFTAAFLFLGLSIFGRSLDLILREKKVMDKSILNWSLFTLSAVAATLINPYGWHLHEKIGEMIFQIKSFALWDEFAPLNFFHPNILVYVFSGIAVSFTLALFSSRPAKWERLLPVAAFLYFGYRVQRHVLLLLIIAAVPVCSYWSGWLYALFSRGKEKNESSFLKLEAESLGHWLFIPLIAAVILFIFVHSPQARSLRVAARNISPEAIAYLRAHQNQFQRPLTTTWNGGPLLYYLAPDLRISFDDRADLYGDKLLQPYIRLLNLKPDWEKTLAQGGYDSAILEKDYPLAEALRQHRGWQMAWEDKLTAIFIRNK